MNYKVSYQNANSHLIDFELKIDKIYQDKIYLQLPAWRPGRYTLQNFAQNIQQFAISDAYDEPVTFSKVSKDRWEVETKDVQEIVIRYNYFASQMDAGGCWLDEHQLYLNWICCGLYVEGRENDNYSLEFELPENYQIACALPLFQNAHGLIAESFYELVDSPMIASPSLQHKTYTCEGIECDFHIWIQGAWRPDWEKVIAEFKAFTKVQVELFEHFPCKEYHFMYQILPYQHYHGVEHRFSTVITLGQDYQMDGELYNEFLGVSSHELFHTWNGTRITPVEMKPYDFRQENYFKTGFVIEGLTTYYGDYLLGKSGVFSQKQFFKELETVFNRHFQNHGRFNLSLADSSYDLWLDGYKAGIPNRKTSIYAKGSVISLILDLEIRHLSKNEKSLDDVLRLLWQNFGKLEKGYSEDDYKEIVEQVAGQSMDIYFQNCVYGNMPLEKYLHACLQRVGLKLETKPSSKFNEQLFGFKLHNMKVVQVTPKSPAEKSLFLGDQLVAVDGRKATSQNLQMLLKNKEQVVVHFFRGDCLTAAPLKADENWHSETYHITVSKTISQVEKQNFKAWFGREIFF
jgi:predicted metalloprotease with PDZ domain